MSHQLQLCDKAHGLLFLTRYVDIEPLMAVRISLIHSTQHRHRQATDMTSLFQAGLADIKRSCLLHVAQAAREASLPQIALKSITAAQSLALPSNNHVELSQEFAHVLWAYNEEKMAVEYLEKLISQSNPLPVTKQANILSQQVSLPLYISAQKSSLRTHKRLSRVNG